MTRKLKVLGLALVAVLAMSAMMASAAQAVEHTFESSSVNEKTILTGSNTGKEVFTVGLGEAEVSCTSSIFEGTVEGNKVKEVTVTPTYGKTTKPSGCEDAVSKSEAIVHTNHCAYILHNVTDANGDAPVSIECSGTPKEEITVTLPALGVTIHVPEQTPAGGVHYTNLKEHGPGKKEAVTVKSTVSGIHYRCTGSEVFCFFLNGVDGTYKGDTDVTGYEDKSASALSGTEKTTPSGTIEGEQVNVTVNPG
jgi:hypothetical protein